MRLDRRRLDSDVRAMLRQPSTPWITFDRASRASHVAAGDVLPGRPSAVVSGGFDHTLPPGDPAAAEPSSMSVASDLDGARTDEIAAVVPAVGRPRRGLAPRLVALATGAALAAAVGLAVLPAPPASAEGHGAETAPVDPDPVPMDLGAETAEVTSPVAPEAPAAPAVGKLSLRGKARKVPVFFDGDRLPGQGTRTLTVACGEHMIGVGSKAKSSRFDVPCDGTIVITR